MLTLNQIRICRAPEAPKFLRHIRDILKMVPEHQFDMGTWGNGGDIRFRESPEHVIACGTRACAAGWAMCDPELTNWVHDEERYRLIMGHTGPGIIVERRVNIFWPEPVSDHSPNTPDRHLAAWFGISQANASVLFYDTGRYGRPVEEAIALFDRCASGLEKDPAYTLSSQCFS